MRRTSPIRSSCVHASTSSWGSAGQRCAYWRLFSMRPCQRRSRRRSIISRGSAHAFLGLRIKPSGSMRVRAMPRQISRCVHSMRAMCSLTVTIFLLRPRRIGRRQRSTAVSLRRFRRLITVHTDEGSGSASGISLPMSESMWCSRFPMR